MQQPHQSLTTYLISFAVIAVVLALRWRRMSQTRPLKLERLWIFPAVLAAVAIALFVVHPPVGWGWAFCVGAAALGAALGWQRGRLMRIEIDPDTHELNQRASPAAILLIIALIVARQGARGLAASGLFAIDPLAVTDVLLALAVGLFLATRLEMYLRGKAMLDEARARRAAGQSSGTA